LFSLFDGLAVSDIDKPLEDVPASAEETSKGDADHPTANGDAVQDAKPLSLQNGLNGLTVA
jgi:hypothetical protein